MAAGLCKPRCRHDHRCDAALHIRSAAAVNFPVHQLGAVRVVLPQAAVGQIDGVDMPVQQDGLPRPVAADAAQHTAIAVDHRFIKALLQHRLLNKPGDLLLLARKAGRTDQRLAKFNELLLCIGHDKISFCRKDRGGHMIASL